jgi:hypothetical protein
MTDPKQTELEGADEFNLIGEKATEYQPPAEPDDKTLDLPLTSQNQQNQQNLPDLTNRVFFYPSQIPSEPF